MQNLMKFRSIFTQNLDLFTSCVDTSVHVFWVISTSVRKLSPRFNCMQVKVKGVLSVFYSEAEKKFI